MEAEGLLSLAGVDGCLFSSSFFPRPLSLLYLKWLRSLACSSFLHLPSLHFHPIVVSALILYLYYNVSCALTSCSSSYGLLIILSDFRLHPLSPLHLLSLFISISLLPLPILLIHFPASVKTAHLPAAPFYLQFHILYSCPVSSPPARQRVRCSGAASPCRSITTWPSSNAFSESYQSSYE